MAAILLVCCCCLISSSAGGAFFGGVIPNTSPHFEKASELRKARKYIDLANELRLLGLEIPESELANEDLTIKNKMIEVFTKIQEKSSKLCEMHTELQELSQNIDEKMKHYMKPGNESILTLKGMKNWREYTTDYLKPTDKMKELYSKLDVTQSKNNCSLQSLDENQICKPFSSINIALEEMNDSCTDLKDMLDLGPEGLVELILEEAKSQTSST